MFGDGASTGLQAGEIHEQHWLEDDGFDELVYRLTIDELTRPIEPETRQLLPNDLENLPPGPFLSVLIESVDRSKLNGHDLVRLLRARERVISHQQAWSAADAVDIAYSTVGGRDADPGREAVPAEFAADEIRAALTLTRRAASNRMDLSFDLCERLPQVWRLLDRGVLDLQRARAIVNGTSHLTEEEAREVVGLIAERAPLMTTGQLAARIRKLCVEANADQAKKRYQSAVDARRLWIEQTVDGTGNIYLLDVPIEAATAIGRRINGHMISLERDGDDRSHDQVRADIACDLLLGKDPTASGRGLIDLRVDLTTLAGLDESSGELAGVGPVVADVARQVAMSQPRAEWRYTVVDEDGKVVSTGVTRRRPDASMTRHLQSAEPTCVFPGCRMPARQCDLDHETPWAKGGSTQTDNLSPKCRHDHILKDHGWRDHRTDSGHAWVSPLGHTYVASGQSP